MKPPPIGQRFRVAKTIQLPSTAPTLSSAVRAARLAIVETNSTGTVRGTLGQDQLNIEVKQINGSLVAGTIAVDQFWKWVQAGAIVPLETAPAPVLRLGAAVEVSCERLILAGNEYVRLDAGQASALASLSRGTTGSVLQLTPSEILLEFDDAPHRWKTRVWLKREVFGTTLRILS